MTSIERLNDEYWWPAILIVVGGVLSLAYWRSRVRRVPRALMVTLGSFATMTGLAAMTFFVWGIGAIWLLLLVSIGLSAVVSLAWASRGLGLMMAAVLTNVFPVVLISVVIANLFQRDTPSGLAWLSPECLSCRPG
jgi:hypothetical protein